MDKLNMQTTNIVDENIKRIGELFPNCLTERLNDEGKPEVAIDFDQLRQELSKDIVEGAEERYQFTWPDKRNAIRLANAPTTDTLRPCREESVDFDNTQNLYIEGDNLQVLKLLRENYLGKVKMIYIDPPYNTGNDFIYNDNFDQDKQEYIHNSGQYDEEGNQLVTNTESNGRFHTDWLNMIYPRLKVAKDLLSDNGVIFISIDDNELDNLLKICCEVFGASNHIVTLIWNKQHSQQQGIFKRYHESVVVFAKNSSLQKNIGGGEGIIEAGAQKKISKANPESTFHFPAGVRFDAPDNTCITGTYGDSEKSTIVEGRLIAKNKKTLEPVTISAGWTQKNQMRDFFDGKEVLDTKGQKVIEFFFNSAGKIKCLKERSKITPPSLLPEYGMVSEQSEALAKILGGHYFDSPKPVNMIKDFIKWFLGEDDICLDFFSGSATTAHAVMQLNAVDGGKRKFIMVQLPEETAEDSEAYKAGYKNICEIGKERIRRAGKKIKEESPLTTQDLDTGFRVLKLDSSNMQDVYYTPAEFNDRDLFEENIKPDRKDEDLLFQCMIELGIELSAKIEKKSIAGKAVWSVSDGYLMACFDEEVNETTITEIARLQPYYFVMRDSSLANDQVADNFEQIFNHYSKDTIRRIL
jgi:adenine-specific DNA-methyltransferase